MNWKQISPCHVKINLEKGVWEHRSHLYDVNQFLNQCLKHIWPDQRSIVFNSKALQSKLNDDLNIYISNNYPLYPDKKAA
jgi:hypothetical protein